MDALFLSLVFGTALIFTLIFSAAINWLLKRYFGVRIYPEDFFKSDKEVWKKWQTYMKLLKRYFRRNVLTVAINALTTTGASTVATSRCQTSIKTISWIRLAMNINEIKRFDCPFKALDEAKRSLKAKGFGERHILMTNGGKYRIINPRTQINNYCMVVARLYHPDKS